MARYAAGILVVAHSGRVLLLRRSDDGTWALPGGMVEPTDAAPPYAALRELMEETGYTGPVDMERASLDVTRSPEGLVFWSFGGRVQREFRPKLNDEHTAAGWYAAESLPTPLHPGVARLFARLGLVSAKDA
jgi:8-oxo-dGTP pyrophosphatase MutT (NUDIX family)